MTTVELEERLWPISIEQDFTIAKFRQWLQDQPKTALFDQHSATDCSLCGYAKHHGYMDPIIRLDDMVPGEETSNIMYQDREAEGLPPWTARYQTLAMEVTQYHERVQARTLLETLAVVEMMG